MVYNIHILQTRKTGRVVAAAAASVLCCMGAVFPATIGVTAASADEPVELVVNGGFEQGHGDLTASDWSIYTSLPG